MVVESDEPAVALGPALAAELHGGIVLQDGVEDSRGQRHALRLARARGHAAAG